MLWLKSSQSLVLSWGYGQARVLHVERRLWPIQNPSNCSLIQFLAGGVTCFIIFRKFTDSGSGTYRIRGLNIEDSGTFLLAIYLISWLDVYPAPESRSPRRLRIQPQGHLFAIFNKHK